MKVKGSCDIGSKLPVPLAIPNNSWPAVCFDVLALIRQQPNKLLAWISARDADRKCHPCVIAIIRTSVPKAKAHGLKFADIEAESHHELAAGGGHLEAYRLHISIYQYS